MQDNAIRFGVAIANAASLSGAIQLGGTLPQILETPATITGTQFTFQVSYDGTTYLNLHKEDGNEYVVTMAASRATRVNPDYFIGAKYVKVRTGTGASPSAQAADRAIGLWAKYTE